MTPDDLCLTVVNGHVGHTIHLHRRHWLHIFSKIYIAASNIYEWLFFFLFETFPLALRQWTVKRSHECLRCPSAVSVCLIFCLFIHAPPPKNDGHLQLFLKLFFATFLLHFFHPKTFRTHPFLCISRCFMVFWVLFGICFSPPKTVPSSDPRLLPAGSEQQGATQSHQSF